MLNQTWKNRDRLKAASVGSQIMQITHQSCPQCGTYGKCRRRDFSPQAWSALLVWEEIHNSIVDQPICEDCYTELREILIEHGDELLNPAAPKIYAVPSQKREGVKSAGRTSVTKSSGKTSMIKQVVQKQVAKAKAVVKKKAKTAVAKSVKKKKTRRLAS